MVVAIALDPHLRTKIAIHIAAQAGNRDTVVIIMVGARGALASNSRPC